MGMIYYECCSAHVVVFEHSQIEETSFTEQHLFVVHSTETLNIIVSDHILEAMDQRSATALILLDLSKVFDSVHHSTLISKLYQIGESPEVVKWFKSYLTGRTQFVRIGTAVSQPFDIT